jgi:protein SCO1/2
MNRRHLPGSIFLLIFALVIFAAAGRAQEPRPEIDTLDVHPHGPDMYMQAAETTPAGVDEHEHIHEMDTTSTESTQAGVEVIEQLGTELPGDITFRDETGALVNLESFIDRPVLILPVFYHCPMACATMLADLATEINRIPLTPGEDYRVLAISFDEEDGPEFAAATKQNYMRLITIPFEEEYWRYLTGDKAEIDRLFNTAGFYYKKLGQHNFLHPNVLIAVSGERKIIRYLYGPDFLPFDMGMALTEARSGKASLSVRKLMTYCFSYEPDQNRYVFSTVRIATVSILVLIGVFLFFLLRKKK